MTTLGEKKLGVSRTVLTFIDLFLDFGQYGLGLLLFLLLFGCLRLLILWKPGKRPELIRLRCHLILQGLEFLALCHNYVIRMVTLARSINNLSAGTGAPLVRGRSLRSVIIRYFLRVAWSPQEGISFQEFLHGLRTYLFFKFGAKILAYVHLSLWFDAVYFNADLFGLIWEPDRGEGNLERGGLKGLIPLLYDENIDAAITEFLSWVAFLQQELSWLYDNTLILCLAADRNSEMRILAKYADLL